MTALALAIVAAFAVAAAIITATVLVHAKRAHRLPDYEEELQRRTDDARMAGFIARQRIKREAVKGA